jgi:hypothetical protein
MPVLTHAGRTAGNSARPLFHSRRRRRLWKTLNSTFLLWRNYKVEEFIPKTSLFEVKSDPMRKAPKRKRFHCSATAKGYYQSVNQNSDISVEAISQNAAEGRRIILNITKAYH